jgi:uncharacterized protein YdhG (YjbR/CyaY superfamily)
LAYIFVSPTWSWTAAERAAIIGSANRRSLKRELRENKSMEEKHREIPTIDDYMKNFPKEVQKKLESIRNLVKKIAPEAQEKISYQMPTFYLNGNLIHFAAFKNHIGLYPTPNGISAFQKELSKYRNAKGSVQFPMDEALPMDLIKRIVKYRLEKNRNKANAQEIGVKSKKSYKAAK